MGFAPTIITVLQTVPITTLARDYMALPPGFEPGPMASETTTLPLRYGSLLALRLRFELRPNSFGDCCATITLSEHILYTSRLTVQSIGINSIRAMHIVLIIFSIYNLLIVYNNVKLFYDDK